jgi:hypothetical protein
MIIMVEMRLAAASTREFGSMTTGRSSSPQVEEGHAKNRFYESTQCLIQPRRVLWWLPNFDNLSAMVTYYVWHT